MVNYEAEIKRLQAEGAQGALYQSYIDAGMSPERAAHYAAGGNEYNDPMLSPEAAQNAAVRGNMRADRDRSVAYGERLNANVDHIMAGGGPQVRDPELLAMMEERKRRDRETTIGSPESLAKLEAGNQALIDSYKADPYTDESGRPMIDENNNVGVHYSFPTYNTDGAVRNAGTDEAYRDQYEARGIVDDPNSDHHGATFNPHTHRYNPRRKRVEKRKGAELQLRRDAQGNSPNLDMETSQEFGNVGTDALGNPTVDLPVDGVDPLVTNPDLADPTTAQEGRFNVTRSPNPYGGDDIVAANDPLNPGMVLNAADLAANNAAEAAGQGLLEAGQQAALDAAANEAEQAAERDIFLDNAAGIGGMPHLGPAMAGSPEAQAMMDTANEWSAAEAENRATAVTDPNYDPNFPDYDTFLENRFLEQNAPTDQDFGNMGLGFGLEGRSPTREGAPPIPNPSATMPMMPQGFGAEPSLPPEITEGHMPGHPGRLSPDHVDHLGPPGLSRPAQSPQAMINSMDDNQIARLRQMIPDPAMAALVIGQLMGGGANINQAQPTSSPANAMPFLRPSGMGGFQGGSIPASSQQTPPQADPRYEQLIRTMLPQ